VPSTTAWKSRSGVEATEEVDERGGELESGSGGGCGGEAVNAGSWPEEAEPRTRALGQGGGADCGGEATARSAVLSGFTRANTVSFDSTAATLARAMTMNRVRSSIVS